MARPKWRRVITRALENSRLTTLLASLSRPNFEQLDPARTDWSLSAHSILQARWPTVSVVVPVFNGPPKLLAKCLQLMMADPNVEEVIVVDDATTEFDVQDLVSSLPQADPLVKVITNSKNLGYTKSINLGLLGTKPQNNLLIMNSDALLVPGSLGRMLAELYACPSLATVTPVSDNAGSFTALPRPILGEDDSNLEAALIEATRMARLLKHQRLTVPTGNGFCMLIRRSAWNEIGPFDEERFPRGYGEENDFCLRAGEAGWTHLVTTSALALHRRTASFSMEESLILKETALRKITSIWPDYTWRTRLAFAPLHALKEQLGVELRRTDTEVYSRPRILIIQPISGGGTKQTNHELAIALSASVDVWMLQINNFHAKLDLFKFGAIAETASYGDPEELLVRSRDSISRHKFNSLVISLFMEHKFDALHVAHLYLQSPDLFSLAKFFGAATSFTAHDFYANCQSLYLLNEKGDFCSGTCGAVSGPCSPSMPNPSSPTNIQGEFNSLWRRRITRALSDCESFIFASKFAMETWRQDLTATASQRYLIPHSVAAKGELGRAEIDQVRVLVLGNMSSEKGADRLTAILSQLSGVKVSFFFAGRGSERFSRFGQAYGEYPPEELGTIFRWAVPNVGLIPSVMPETFSRVLSEFWNFGVPVIAPDFGAFTERFVAPHQGWLISQSSFAQEAVNVLRLIESKGGGVGFTSLQLAEQWNSNSPEAWRDKYLKVWGL